MAFLRPGYAYGHNKRSLEMHNVQRLVNEIANLICELPLIPFYEELVVRMCNKLA